METTSRSSADLISSDVSEEERRRYLESLQEADNRLLVPTVIFLITVAVVGLLGNSMVLLVYSRKARQSATDVFIMAIAAFDLLTNVVAIPSEIYDTFHYWDFHNVAACKFRVYVNAFTVTTSALALLAVAFTRYRKICRPFGRQTSIKTARVLVVAIALTCSVIATPQPILYGLQTRSTPRDNITGQECDISDNYVDTIWPMIFAGFLMLLFMLNYIPLIVLYVLVGIQAWRHSRVHGVSAISNIQTATYSEGTMSGAMDSEDNTYRRQAKSKSNYGIFASLFKKKNDKNCQDISMNAVQNDTYKKDEGFQMERTNEETNGNPSSFSTTVATTGEITERSKDHVVFDEADAGNGQGVRSDQKTHETSLNANSDAETGKHRSTTTTTTNRAKKNQTRTVLNRTTLMLLIITAVYVLAFVPYLILVSLKFASSSFYNSLNSSEESLYNLFLRFFFLNSAANPIVYSILDKRFRSEIVKNFKCKK